MNPRMNAGGLSLPLRTDLVPCRSTTGRDNRLHGGSPGYVYRGIAISVIGMSAVHTQKRGLTLAIGLLTMSAHATRFRGVGGVYRMEWHASKNSFIREEETQLEECP